MKPTVTILINSLCSGSKSYLTDGIRLVLFKGQSSSFWTITAGALQDSFLGPLLFVMFINDLPEHVHTQVDMFAGDTTFLAAFDFANAEDLWNTPTSMRNKLVLNCSKTKTILIDRQRLGKRLNNEEFWFHFVRLDTPGKRLNNEDRKLEIQLKGCNLEQATNFRMFGLDIDEQLSFDVHIDCLSKKIIKAYVSAYVIELRVTY